MEHRYTILVALNEPVNVLLYKKLLEKRGYDVLTAESGEESLQIMQVIVPDLVLLDLLIPGKDGFKVLAEIKRNPLIQAVPVIIVTELDNNSSKERAFHLGASAYITIPVSAKTILDRIDALLNSIKLQDIPIPPGNNQSR